MRTPETSQPPCARTSRQASAGNARCPAWARAQRRPGAPTCRGDSELILRSDVENRKLRNGLTWAALLTALAVAVVAVVPAMSGVRQALPGAAPGWVALALGFELLSCWSYVATFRLVFRDTPPRIASRVAWSEMAFGAVVPLGGAGGVAIGAWILHVKGVPLRLAARLSAVLFLATSAVNLLVLAVAGAGLASQILPGPHPVTLGLLPAAVALVTIAAFAAVPRASRRSVGSRGRLSRWSDATADTVRATEQILASRDWRLGAALGYLLFDIAVLWACFRAFGVSPGLAPLVLGYQIGYLGNLLPVPGGVAVLDGGMIGALLLYGTPAAATAAAVVLYHAIALWLPTLGGTVKFVLLRRTLYDPLPLSAWRAVEDESAR